MAALRISTLLVNVLMSGSLNASMNNYWQLDSDNDGISIYSREHIDGLVEIRARMLTPTSYGAFLTLLEDSENAPH